MYIKSTTKRKFLIWVQFLVLLHTLITTYGTYFILGLLIIYAVAVCLAHHFFFEQIIQKDQFKNVTHMYNSVVKYYM